MEDDLAWTRVRELSASGDDCLNSDDFDRAVDLYQEALDLVSSLEGSSDAAAWLCTAMGEALYFKGDFSGALSYLSRAISYPGKLGNPLIHLRLGQAFYELGDFARAGDELTRAYMSEGRDIFEDENEKYLNFLSEIIQVEEGS